VGRHYQSRPIESPPYDANVPAAALLAIGVGVGCFGTLVGAGGGFLLVPLLALLGGVRQGAVFYEDRKLLGRPAKAKWVITHFEPDRVFGAWTSVRSAAVLRISTRGQGV
jgi:hypothetical protein